MCSDALLILQHRYYSTSICFSTLALYKFVLDVRKSKSQEDQESTGEIPLVRIEIKWFDLDRSATAFYQ